MNSVSPQGLDQFITSNGQSLDALSRNAPVLIIFLRHGGCPFCRQALADLALKRQEIESAGITPVLIHMMSPTDAASLFAKYQLDDLPHIGDLDGKVYQAFGMKPGTINQIIGPRVWWEGFKAAVVEGHWPGIAKGNVYRMPGAFVLYRGEVLDAVIPGNSSERIDFGALASCTRCVE
ncbi:MAG: redoxin domain-containing protein [Planctomycetaceae bacterium]